VTRGRSDAALALYAAREARVIGRSITWLDWSGCQRHRRDCGSSISWGAGAAIARHCSDRHVRSAGWSGKGGEPRGPFPGSL